MKPENPKRNGKKSTKAATHSTDNHSKASKPPIPPILLEGDESPAHSRPSGPGQRYALGTVPQEAPKTGETGELPEAYGTKRLLLTARDPHWLYAHWDLNREQLRDYNQLSIDRHLILRVYKDEVRGQPVSEIHVHPESRNWFVNVPYGGTKYVTELGFYGADRKWVTISTS